MKPIRVLVVDDSVVVRRLVTTVLDEDADIEVATTAANGQIALDKLAIDLPDVVTLDMEMPVMDGLATLREIRKRWPRLPVIMFSTLTMAGATATLDALSAGASDFVAKPANVGSVALGMQAIREQLIPKVKVLAGRPLPTLPSPSPARLPDSPAVAPRQRLPIATPPLGDAPTTPTAPLRTAAGGRVTAVVIGVSTGGPNALAEIWPNLRTLTVPVLVVQHMPPVFTTMLAKRLDALGSVPMSEGLDGCAVERGRSWLAPGDHHMYVAGSAASPRIEIDQAPPENSCRPAVDPLFRSAAKVFGAGTLAVILTGMGTDGVNGAMAVRQAGGTVIAQDEESSVVWGMPGAVTNAGLADAVVPLDRMAAEIVARCSVGSLAMSAASRRVGAS